MQGSWGHSDSPWRVFFLFCFLDRDPHSTDKETKPQGGYLFCPRSNDHRLAGSGFKCSSTDPHPVFCPQHLHSSAIAAGWSKNVSRMLHLQSYIILQGESEERVPACRAALRPSWPRWWGVLGQSFPIRECASDRGLDKDPFHAKSMAGSGPEAV